MCSRALSLQSCCLAVSCGSCAGQNVYSAFASPLLNQIFIWIYYTSPFAFTNQALFKLVFAQQDMKGWTKCIRKQKYPCYGDTGADVLDAISSEELEYNDVDPLLWFLILCVFAVGLRAQFYFFLRPSVMDLRKKNQK